MSQCIPTSGTSTLPRDHPRRPVEGGMLSRSLLTPLVIHLASGSFVKGKCDTENQLDYMTNG